MKKAINAPKMNSVAKSCNAIAAIAAQGVTVDGLTPLGHKAGCKGGVIDACILGGKVHSIESFIDTLINSGINAAKNDRAKYSNDTLRAVMAKRTVDHVSWCANTANQSHGGFGSRLNNVGLAGQQAAIAQQLTELAQALTVQFKAEYSKLYKNK